MNATPSRSFPPLNSLPCADVGTAGSQKSRSKVLVQSFGKDFSASELASGVAHQRARDIAQPQIAGDTRPLPLAADDFRIWFLPTFARWLQANFRDPETVAASFNVRHQTALNWWHGANRASGDTMALVFMTFPQAVGWFLAEWEARD